MIIDKLLYFEQSAAADVDRAILPAMGNDPPAVSALIVSEAQPVLEC